MSGLDKALPMNSGTEAVETALKVVRKWGYQKKGIAAEKAQVIVCQNNFHGRSITIVGFSSEAEYQDGFGPFAEGFVEVPFGDIDALKGAINENTAAFLVEPIQGEGGIIIPPEGYLREAFDLCKKNNVLFVADEIQTGLGRCGEMFACDFEQVKPDVLILGKALSGGVLPISAVVARNGILDVIEPGQHGSTFGGNPLAAAVGKAALQVIVDEGLVRKSRELGKWFIEELRKLSLPYVSEIRGRGLLIGIELDRPARPFCEALKAEGVLCKETHEMVIRIAPPLIASKDDLQWALERLSRVLY
jgi:ornithine--oxo-acid transaminase